MTNRPALPEPWSVLLSAVAGAVTGILIATAWHFSHDHVGYTPDELIAHFVPRLIAGVTGFAILFAIAAIVWNRLKRH
jgi:lysylphosphatidylglycerol synthetase-like protein (DUF2156 family)